MWKTFGEYFWMWMALFGSILLYIPLWLWMRGNILLYDVAPWWKFRFQRAINDPDLRARRSRSLIMLAYAQVCSWSLYCTDTIFRYPAVYCALVLPMSIVRWLTFVHDVNSVSSTATFIVVSIFGLSGFVNIILLLTTRPQSGLFGQLMFGDDSDL